MSLKYYVQPRTPAQSLNYVQFFVTPWTIYSPPGSSVLGFSQAKILEWVAISFSRGSSQPTYLKYIFFYQMGMHF